MTKKSLMILFRAILEAVVSLMLAIGLGVLFEVADVYMSDLLSGIQMVIYALLYFASYGAVRGVYCVYKRRKGVMVPFACSEEFILTMTISFILETLLTGDSQVGLVSRVIAILMIALLFRDLEKVDEEAQE